MKITLLKGLLMVGALLCFGLTQAQDVSGNVSDVNGPLPGASVLVKGTTNGTQTDFDGNYTLNNVASDATLVFSYLGYSTIEVPVNGQSSINVTLQEDAEALEEVVIIGYGTTTVKDATGAVAAVSADDFNGGVISSPEQLIQGKTAGVQITQTSGEPGAGIEFRIRGTNSVRSNNNPLFVVDGVPLAGDDTAANGQDLGLGTSSSRNPLNFLNPADIESISILKDASATAIYGSRGANGVVIITTKSGKGGGSQGTFGFTSSLSISTPQNEYDLLDNNEFLAAVTQFGGNAAERNAGFNTNWQDVVTRTVASHNQNLTYSRNYGGGNVRATFGYGDQYGVIENSSLERITGRLNWDHRFLDDKLNVTVSATASRVNDEAPLVSGSAGFQGDLLGAAYSANPTWPADPEFDPGGQLNPANLLENYSSYTQTNRYLINGSVEYDFTPELSAKVSLGYDNSSSSRNSALSGNVLGLTNGTAGNGRGSLNDIDVENRLMEITMNYNKDFGNSQLDALVGYSFQDFGRSGRNIQGWGYATTNLKGMSRDLERSADAIEGSIAGSYQQYGYATNRTDVFVNRLFPEPTTDVVNLPVGGIGVRAIFGDTFDFTDELQSFFGRINYSLANKYLFTATLRADGSSRFGPDNQYGYFPSGAFAWKINEEDFIGDGVSTLKLRVGGGITGNQEGLGYGNFVRRERYGGAGIGNNGEIGNVPGLAPQSFVNNELKWEETLQYGVGVDFGFNNDRFSGTVDVYRKETQDLLLSIPAAQPSPQPFFFQNLDATMLNQGIELTLAYDFVQSADFNMDASFNISYNENELQDFAGQIPAGTIRGQGLSLAFAQILAGDRPLFSYFLREFEGFDANGQPIGDVQTFVDEDALPDVIAGFSLNATYKNWDFNAYMTGQFGFSVYNNTRNAFFTAGSINNARNVTPDVLTSGESGNAAAEVSTRFLEKGDFVRMQNATIGYTVPLTGDGLFKYLKLSVTGQNLFLITDYTGLDPEVSVQPGSFDLLNGLPTAGIDYTAFPRPRTVTFAVNAKF